MKTAEEWVQATDKLLPCYGPIREARIKFYQQIQLDAMKEGMRRAEVVVSKLKTNFRNVGEMKQDSRQAILTAAEQLTEKDL